MPRPSNAFDVTPKPLIAGGLALPWLLAALPVACFCAEYFAASRSGTLPLLRAHPTVMVADWLLVPFNFLLTRIIDWSRGLRLFVLGAAAAVVVALGHAVWQAHGTAPAGFLAPDGAVTPSGWIHLAYSVIQATLLLAFVFCRRAGAPRVGAARALAVAYMVGMAIGGYVFHHRVVAEDAVIVVAGLALLLFWRGD